MDVFDTKIEGIGLILVAKDTGRIYTVRELQGKPLIRKEAGMISFPLETVEEKETYHATIKRLIDEEITGCVYDDITDLFISLDSVMIVPGVRAYIAWGFCEREFDAVPKDRDVAFNGWCSIAELLEEESFVRVETQPLLKIFLSGEK